MEQRDPGPFYFPEKEKKEITYKANHKIRNCSSNISNWCSFYTLCPGYILLALHMLNIGILWSLMWQIAHPVIPLCIGPIQSRTSDLLCFKLKPLKKDFHIYIPKLIWHALYCTSRTPADTAEVVMRLQKTRNNEYLKYSLFGPYGTLIIFSWNKKFSSVSQNYRN